MRIIRVFPKRTSYTPIDDYVFIGMPPLKPFIPLRGPEQCLLCSYIETFQTKRRNIRSNGIDLLVSGSGQRP